MRNRVDKSEHCAANSLLVAGRGCTGVVRLGTHKESGFRVAFKIIKKSYLDSVSLFFCAAHCRAHRCLLPNALQKPKSWQKVKREIAVLKLIDHPHILKLYDVLETKDRLYLVRCAHSLLSLLTVADYFDSVVCSRY